MNPNEENIEVDMCLEHMEPYTLPNDALSLVLVFLLEFEYKIVMYFIHSIVHNF